MEFAESDTRQISVVDDSGLVAPRLTSDEEVEFKIVATEMIIRLHGR